MKPLAIPAVLALMLAAPSVGIAQEAISPEEQVIVEKLSKLDGNKLMQLFSHMDIAPSADFLNCLCPGEYGFHYFTEGPAGTSCRRIGPLGGTEFRGFVSGKMGSCSAAYPLTNGRTVLGAIADAAKPEVECAVGDPPVAFASTFSYAGMLPALFGDVDPERIIHQLAPGDRELLKDIGDSLTRTISEAIGAVIDPQSYSATSSAEFIGAIGHRAWTSLWAGHLDARVEIAFVEVGFTYDLKTMKFVPTEGVLKIPVFGKGQNIEIAAGIADKAWNGKIKLGYSHEAIEGKGWQAEGKVGFEYDTRAIVDADVISDPQQNEALPAGTLQQWHDTLESLLAGVDLYGGGAIGAKEDVIKQFVLGPEITWSLKEIYSDALVEDMMQGLDNVLIQQKALEEARHENIRRIARDYGVEGAGCLPLTQVMVELQDRIRHLAIVNHIPFEGRKFSDIRKDLEKLPK